MKPKNIKFRRSEMHKQIDENRDKKHIKHVALIGIFIGVLILLFAGLDVASACETYISVTPGESIQDAIDFICPEGGVVELAPGVHDVYEPIVINKSNITIQGTHESVIRVNDRYKPAFVIPHENPSDEEDWENMPVLENFIFKGFNATSSYEGNRGETLILAWNVKNITVEDIWDNSYNFYLIKVNPTGGDTSAHSEDIFVKGNYCLHSGFICFCYSKNIHVINNTLMEGGTIDINRNNEYVYIYNNTIFDGGYNYNIRGHGANYVYIENNALFGGSQRCIYCDGLSNTVIKNNTMTGAWWAAIHINVQWGLSNISIINNRIYNNSGHGIWTTQYSYGFSEENTDVTLTNNVIANNSGDGIRMTTKWVQFKNISNNIITNNGGYGINYMDTVEPTTIKYNDVWNNSLGNYNNTTPGTGDISEDPLFADPANGDFHLKSQAGRWNGTDWVYDNETSPCIDAGDPNSSYSNETYPHGQRINMGAYGNTPEASKSPYHKIYLGTEITIHLDLTRSYPLPPKSYYGNLTLDENFSATPTLNPVTINITRFNTSLPQGEILVNFTANTTDGNNVNFTICSLKPNTSYTIKKDGIDFATKTTNESGCLTFNNSQWTEHTFTIEEHTTPTTTTITSTSTSTTTIPGTTTTTSTSTTTTSTSTSTTTTLGTTTTTTIWPCDLPGDYPPCGEVTLEEVVDFINLWSLGQADLGDVVNLINAWAGS